MAKKTIIYVRKVSPDKPREQEAVYIHDDLVAKAVSGVRSSPKVSDIRFDDGPRQEWVAVLRDGRELCRDKDRGTVVQMEADIIAKMFARGEYIPGGYNGEPRHKLPPDMDEIIKNYVRFLGRHELFDLYSFGAGAFVIKSECGKLAVVSGNRISESAVCELCRVGKYPDLFYRNYRNEGFDETSARPVYEEALRRHKIEQEIEREEKLKTQSHA